MPYIRETLPQVNEKTKVQAVQATEVRIVSMDPIRVRAAYNTPVCTLEGTFWRIAGKLFKRPDWSGRGWIWEPPVYQRERIIELRMWRVQGGWPLTYSQLMMGYDPETDTLYINPEYTVWMESL